jgi:serine/threonine-protein kinase
VFNSSCTKDQVVSQDAKPNSKITQGSAVSYQVCGGPQSTSVPQLAGLTKAAAEQALNAAKLKAAFQDVHGLVDSKGKVVAGSVNPKEGTNVPEGSTVTLSISLGDQNVVPDLTGLSQDQAQTKLNDLGFTKVAFVPRDSAPDQVGKVTGQTVSSGTTKFLTDSFTVFIGRTQASPTPPASPTPSTSPTSGG